MSSNDLQLEMNFSEKKQNRFRKTVESGTFSLLIESFVPGPQLPAKDAVKQLRALEEEVAAVSAIPCGVAIVDRSGNPEGLFHCPRHYIQFGPPFPAFYTACYVCIWLSAL